MASSAVASVGTESPSHRPREEAVARLWRNAHTLSEGLQTEDGRRFRVLYPGRPGGGAGPDFRDTIVATEAGELVTGDVEIHVKASDWNSHRHQVDPNYNGVILHVVLYPTGLKTSDQQSRISVPVASLGAAADTLRRAEDSGGAGATALTGLDIGSVSELLDRAGDQRFLAKSAGFALEMERADADETLYGAIMEALGYSANRKPFRDLARMVPVSRLTALRREPPSTRLLAIKAIFFRAAGLATPPAEAQQLKALLRRLPRTPTMAPGSWRLTGVRPANHPATRLTGAAYLFDRYVESGLGRGIERDVAGGGPAYLVNRLTVRPFIGTSRAREIGVNVVLPYIHALAGMKRDPERQLRCLEMYRAFPKLADNGITREMRRLLSAEGRCVKIKGARRQQGLIQLYRMMTRRVSQQA